MAITGVSAISGQQIIAAGAVSSKTAATAEYTTGGGSIQGLYNTVNTNSGDWNTVTDKLNTTAFSTVSGSFITSLPQNLATTGDIQDLAESISETYQEKTGMTAYLPVGDYMTADALTGVSSTWNTVTNKLDTTAFSTVSGSFLTAHQELSESATWNTVTSKLDTTAFSTVSGDFLTAHQSLSESANWNYTYNTVSDNSASWATVTAKLDTTAFSTVSGNFLTTHQSLPQSANWNDTTYTVSSNSGAWGGSVLNISAGNGIALNLVDGVLVISVTGA